MTSVSILRRGDDMVLWIYFKAGDVFIQWFRVFFFTATEREMMCDL